VCSSYLFDLSLLPGHRCWCYHLALVCSFAVRNESTRSKAHEIQWRSRTWLGF
jgi:hypothetical protein